MRERRLLLVIFVLGILLSCTNSSKNYPSLVETNRIFRQNERFKDIELVIDETYSEELFFTLSFTNTSDIDITLSSGAFIIDYYEGDRWLNVDLSNYIAFSDLGFILNQGETFTREIDLNWIPVTFPKGRYRFVIEIDEHIGFFQNTSNPHTLHVYFNL